MQPDAVNVVPMDWKASDWNIFPPPVLFSAVKVPFAPESILDRVVNENAPVDPATTDDVEVIELLETTAPVDATLKTEPPPFV